MPRNRVDVVWAEDSGVDQYFIANVLAAEAPRLQVAFAADGAEALALAERHQPALVVLDLRMPALNGLEAVRRLRASHPSTKAVLFTSTLPGDPLLAEAGPLGVSVHHKPLDFSAFRGAVLRIVQDVGLLQGEPSAARPPRPTRAVNHQVLFWGTPTDFDAAVVRFLQAGQAEGRALIVLARRENLKRLRAAVNGPGHWLDADEVAAAITPPGGRPDPRAFARLFAEAAAKASEGGTRPVTCFGELVELLRTQGFLSEALAIEAVGQQAAHKSGDGLSILCAYSASVMADPGAFGSICAQHHHRLLPLVGMPLSAT